MRLGHLKVIEWIFEVPKDYLNPERGLIQVFGRSVSKDKRPAVEASKDERDKAAQLPWLVYLQVLAN
jgi:hypothetical protein